MSDLIEMMARAMTRASCTGPRDHLDEQEEKYWKQREHMARVALTAINASGEWAVVPVEPSENQLFKASKIYGKCTLETVRDIYSAMLAARPKVG